ncbi:MAG: integrase, partial [Gammaproteobacteria bacterium]|nr:integrase [Gammaproteobacteria bacterium]
MRDLNYQLKRLVHQHKEDAFRTRNDRSRHLQLIANQLHELGFRQLKVTSLREKHVIALVQRWQTEGLSDGSIKNRMASLRWWANKINKPVIANDNTAYGIGRRQFVTNSDHSAILTTASLNSITDPYVAMSLRLQA